MDSSWQSVFIIQIYVIIIFWKELDFVTIVDEILRVGGLASNIVLSAATVRGGTTTKRNGTWNLFSIFFRNLKTAIFC